MRLASAADSVLAVIDVQSRLLSAMKPGDAERVLHRSGVLIRAARALALPIFVTEQYPRGLGPTHDALALELPPDARTFEKSCFSACGAGGYIDALRATGRKQVVLAGMESHVCVLQTAAELDQAGFEVFVAGDATCSRAENNRQNALARMRQAGITVTNAESVVFEWLRDASHERFKEIASLIK